MPLFMGGIIPLFILGGAIPLFMLGGVMPLFMGGIMFMPQSTPLLAGGMQFDGMGMLGPLAGGVAEGGIMLGLFIGGLPQVGQPFMGGGMVPPQLPPLQDMAEPLFMSIGGVGLPIMLPPHEGPEHCAGGCCMLGLPIMVPPHEGSEHCAGWGGCCMLGLLIMLPPQEGPEHGGGCCIEEGGVEDWLPHAHGASRLIMLMRERMPSPLPQLHWLEPLRPPSRANMTEVVAGATTESGLRFS